MSPVSSGSASPERKEFTVDELATRADMTVRNVRAYASQQLGDLSAYDRPDDRGAPAPSR